MRQAWSLAALKPRSGDRTQPGVERSEPPGSFQKSNTSPERAAEATGFGNSQTHAALKQTRVPALLRWLRISERRASSTFPGYGVSIGWRLYPSGFPPRLHHKVVFRVECPALVNDPAPGPQIERSLVDSPPPRRIQIVRQQAKQARHEAAQAFFPSCPLRKAPRLLSICPVRLRPQPPPRQHRCLAGRSPCRPPALSQVCLPLPTTTRQMTSRFSPRAPLPPHLPPPPCLVQVKQKPSGFPLCSRHVPIPPSPQVAKSPSPQVAPPPPPKTPSPLPPPGPDPPEPLRLLPWNDSRGVVRVQRRHGMPVLLGNRRHGHSRRQPVARPGVPHPVLNPAYAGMLHHPPVRPLPGLRQVLRPRASLGGPCSVRAERRGFDKNERGACLAPRPRQSPPSQPARTKTPQTLATRSARLLPVCECCKSPVLPLANWKWRIGYWQHFHTGNIPPPAPFWEMRFPIAPQTTARLRLADVPKHPVAKSPCRQVSLPACRASVAACRPSDFWLAGRRRGMK